MDVLAALCDILDCTPNDLFEVDPTPVAEPVKPVRASVEEPKKASARGRSMPPL